MHSPPHVNFKKNGIHKKFVDTVYVKISSIFFINIYLLKINTKALKRKIRISNSITNSI